MVQVELNNMCINIGANSGSENYEPKKKHCDRPTDQPTNERMN